LNTATRIRLSHSRGFHRLRHLVSLARSAVHRTQFGQGGDTPCARLARCCIVAAAPEAIANHTGDTGEVMRITCLAAALTLTGAFATTQTASAQTVVDDVRCVLLSNVVARGITDPKAKSLAEESLSFYLGRLDRQASDQAITDAMRSIPPAIGASTAKDMEACLARVRQAKLRMQSIGSAVQGQVGK
jgi:hypothetical protein